MMVIVFYVRAGPSVGTGRGQQGFSHDVQTQAASFDLGGNCCGGVKGHRF